MNYRGEKNIRYHTAVFSAMLLSSLTWMNNAWADIRLSPVFSSNMVLQRDVPVKISGWANVGETVVVKLGNQVVGNAVGAGPEKSWTVALPVLKAGPIQDITIEGKNTITLANLLAGDVWICSGQSNMEMSVAKGSWCPYGGVLNAEKEVEEASYAGIRLVISSGRGKGDWQSCTPETVGKFSATAYFFGRELHRELNVPIGLVQAAVGGTRAEYWTPLSIRKSWPSYAEARVLAEGELKKLEPIVIEDRMAQTEWVKASETAKKNGTNPPAKPVAKITSEQYARYSQVKSVTGTGDMFESRVRPFSVFPVKGAIWYQGEGNALSHTEYAELLTQLIAGWRQTWNQQDLPFIIMQLVNFGGANGQEWSALRAAQQKVAETVPNTGLAVGIDIGDPKNIHPANKQEVGRRLALVALKQVYGKDVVFSGPKLTDARFESGRAVLSFDLGDKGQQLVMKNGADSGFELAGKDGKFVPGIAEVQGNTITVAAETVHEPLAIRYAWKDNPSATIFNSDGLPAAPFQMNAGGENIK